MCTCCLQVLDDKPEGGHENHRPDHNRRLGTDRTVHPRLGPRRAERQQGVDGGGTALRGGTLAQPARCGETTPAPGGGATVDERRRGGDPGGGNTFTSPQPRDRAGASGRVDPQSLRKTQTEDPNAPHLGVKEAPVEGEEGTRGGEGA